MNKILQFDGNVSVSSVSSNESQDQFPLINRNNRASSLPTVATYNMRSLLPKVNSLKTDINGRDIDVAFLQEIWEDSDDLIYQYEIEKMFELNGLKYVSSPRKKGGGKCAYGGAAMICIH